MKSDPQDSQAPLNAPAPPSSYRRCIEDPVTDPEDAHHDPRGDSGEDFRLQRILDGEAHRKQKYGS